LLSDSRKDISQTIFKELNSGYCNKLIQFYECPTGSGKTTILLESAARLREEFGTSVIISTSTNNLALEYLKYKNLDHLESFYGTTLSNNDLELMLGVSNFLDIETVSILSQLEPTFSLDMEDVQRWYNSPENRKLVSVFIKDFNIDPTLEDVLSLKDSNKEEDIVTIKNFPYFLQDKDNPKIFITNHLFLISLVEILSKHKNKHANTLLDFSNIPILIDEAHDLQKMAKLRYSASFSPYRLSFLLNGLQKKANSKPTSRFNILCDDVRSLFYRTQNQINLVLAYGDEGFNEYYETTRLFYEKYNQKEFFNILDAFSKNLIDTNSLRQLRKAKMEFSELIDVFRTKQMKYKQINFSPRLGYSTVTSIKNNVKYELRSNFWQFVGNVLLLSGTFRKEVNDKTPAKNTWAMERLGLFEYKRTDSLSEEQFHFNSRLFSDVRFKIFTWIFDRANFKYITIIDENIQPRRSYGKSSDIIIQDKKDWSMEVSRFFYYYYGSLFCKKNTLILTGSYLESEMLSQSLEHSGIPKSKIFFENKSESLSSIFASYEKEVSFSDGNILIGTLTMFTGLNLKDNLCGYIIMTKLPFLPRTGSKDTQSSVNNKYEMTYLFRQGSGRGSRNEKDQVALFILDKRIGNRQEHLYGFLDEMGEKIEFEMIRNSLGDYRNV